MTKESKKTTELTNEEYERRRAKRPKDYMERTHEERKKIDEALGLLDKETGISLL